MWKVQNIVSSFHIFTSSCTEGFFKKGVLENEKLLKSDPVQVFSCEFCESFKSTYFGEHSRMTFSVFWWSILLIMYCSERCELCNTFVRTGTTLLQVLFKTDVSQKFHKNYRTTPVLDFLLKCKPLATELFSCEFCKTFKKNCFTGHLWTTASVR